MVLYTIPYFFIRRHVIERLPLIYNIGFKKSFKREKEYYEVILKTLIGSLTSGKKENVLEQIKGKIRHIDDFVPKYVLYLVDKGEDEKLLKVLLYDYFDIYPYDDNSIKRMIRVARKICVYVLLFSSFVILVLGSIQLVIGANDLIFEVANKNSFVIEFSASIKLPVWLYEMLMGMVGFIMYLVAACVAMRMNSDRYSVRKKQIEQMINMKVKSYDKRKDKYVY